MEIKLKNVIAALKDQLPILRFIRNFFITRNAWCMFYKTSHVSTRSGKDKVMYKSKTGALAAAASMEKKKGVHFSAYKCMFCDGYYIGRNRDNK